MPDLMNQPQKLEQIQQQFFVSGGESLLSKMGGMLLAKAFLPSGAHIKQALVYLDLAIKTELVLVSRQSQLAFQNDLTASLFWFSLVELALFIFSMLLFFTDPTEMVYIWFHIFHVLRGGVGLILMKKLPKSHQMASNMSIPKDDKMTFQAIMNYIILAARDALKDFSNQTRKWLIIYFISTIVCLLLDLIQFFSQIKDFGMVQSAYADLSMITIASIFLFIDWYYIVWILSLQYKFPNYISAQFVKGLFGLMESLHSSLGNYISSQKSYFDEQYHGQAQRYNYVEGDDIGISAGSQPQNKAVNYPKPQQETLFQD
ncbi:UNKNOWN [Stylonychia lemnae]|uniref:Transmembrane protein n=1 Tax=Stylonychia lemnae TaxID=5949 RepID=A0A078ANH2_STYLE|nr:UNKNOWN [Stylonychia lemnae]|eukprot:CDW82513.1 UNKNOWN [Stylonychia lemnae]